MNNGKNGKIELLRFTNLATFPEVGHFVSTRKGGVSKSPFDSLNLGLHVEDGKQSVLENRQILADTLELKPDDFVFMKQVHSGKVAVVGLKQRGKGAKAYEDAMAGVDALITTMPGVCLIVQVADCVPILLFDTTRKVVAAAHAGWKGTMKQIIKSTVEKMQQDFGSKPENLVAGIGPAVGPCCYELLDWDLTSKWERMYSAEDEVVIQREGNKFLDLWQANKIQLLRLGVQEKNIEIMRICTSCNTGKFYSYKKEGKTGRFGVGIMLTDNL